MILISSCQCVVFSESVVLICFSGSECMFVCVDSIMGVNMVRVSRVILEVLLMFSQMIIKGR